MAAPHPGTPLTNHSLTIISRASFGLWDILVIGFLAYLVYVVFFKPATPAGMRILLLTLASDHVQGQGVDLDMAAADTVVVAVVGMGAGTGALRRDVLRQARASAASGVVRHVVPCLLTRHHATCSGLGLGGLLGSMFSRPAYGGGYGYGARPAFGGGFGRPAFGGGFGGGGFGGGGGAHVV